MDPSRLRIGLGHDTHRLGEGSRLRIGGVDVEFNRSLIGHSDADVLLHAITDAILGAASLGDIGTLFPNDDPANRNRDSMEMLSIAREKIVAEGYSIVNLDCVIFAERPKMSGYREQIKSAVARALLVDKEQVGVKAKTGEGVDAVGKGEAISAQCVALLCRGTG